MESRLALVRATHLNNYISVLRDVGAPVDRDLARSSLPSRIEDTPDLFVSVPRAMDWIGRSGRDIEPMELGLLGARNLSLSSLTPAHQATIITAQTGLMRLRALTLVSRFEDSALEVTFQPEGTEVRVICDMVGLRRHPFICFAEWLNLQSVIAVVRSVAGESWCPSELCFVSSSRLPDAVQAAFPNTRLRVGQPHTSVTVGLEHLAQPTGNAAEEADHEMAASRPEDAQSEIWEFVSLLRMLVQPYLSEGRTNVAFAAEMAAVSTRTLQRRLRQCGTSYSRILQEARFDLARRLLDDESMKIIDVAMMAGYESPQHFSRAFRRYAGVTPSQYRYRGSEASPMVFERRVPDRL